LPPTTIHVVHRSDGSGTTYIFSDYLSAVSPAWAAGPGSGKTLTWPAGDGAEGNGGVATAVNRTPYSIGYIEQAYSMGLTLPFAAVRNQAGNYVTPSARTVAADAAGKPAITPADFSIVSQPGPASYPISGYNWALISTRQHSQASGQAPGHHARLAHPRRPGRRRRQQLRPPPAPARAHHAPAGHRPLRPAAGQLTPSPATGGFLSGLYGAKPAGDSLTCERQRVLRPENKDVAEPGTDYQYWAAN
jgi:phosphate transport system substrate-binding protein